MPPAPPMSNKDGMQVLKLCFDETTGRLRVDASVTAIISDLEIRASTGDNIAIADQSGTNTMEVNPDGSINVTDNGGSITVDGTVSVNNFPASQVVTATDLDIRNLVPAQDKVAIGDGVDTLAVNADGSINTQATIAGEVSIEISAADGDNIAISDGVDTMSVNADGSINVLGPLTDTQLRASPVPISAASLPLPLGASTSALQTTGNASLSSIDSKLTSPLTINLPTGASTSALQTTGNTSLSSIDGKLNSLGQKASAASVPVVLASNQSAIPTSASTPVAGTVTQAAISVGLTAVRATVSGSAPSAARSVLIVNPDPASAAKFYVGSSSVTSTGGTRGVQLNGGDKVAFNSDAADYYIISDTAAQTVFIVEQA